MPRFFCRTSVAPQSRFTLDPEVAQHVRVLRLREGDAVVLFDGNGGETPATLSSIGKREVEVTTTDHVAIEREATRAMTLYAALIANDRMDWMIQKAVELGVVAIQPLLSERSQRIPGDEGKRLEHWRAIAIAASEQCGRNRIAALSTPIKLQMAIEATQGEASRNLLLDADASTETPPAGDACNIFVGPEGGFSASERDALLQHCRNRLRIGATVLRAETAAVAALAILGARA
jgi:16S rRNA (uracil1498-N3)-methyltransferase